VRGGRLETLRGATRALLARLSPRDRATLITFDHRLAVGPTDAAPDALQERIATLTAGGSTSLVDAVTSALAWSTGRGRPVLVLVFSDGRDTASWTRGEQALALARVSDVVVDAVVTGDLAPTGRGTLRTYQAEPRRGRVSQPTLSMDSAMSDDATRLTSDRFLARLTDITSGRVLDGDAGGVPAAFEASLAQFRTRYELTYTPTAPAPGWHDISIDVKGHRGATVHARRGYRR
jgi:hypothetical protein